MTTQVEPQPILLVWTAGASREGVRSLLEAMGLGEVRVAGNAVAAFSELALFRPRLILVEANMKPTSGLIFVRELRATPIANRDVPIIVCAARPSEATEAAARQAGADGVTFGALTAPTLKFWLTSTETDARNLVTQGIYHGPDRRLLIHTDASADERRDTEPAAVAAALARVAAANADPIVQTLARAMERVQSWSESGEENLIRLMLADVRQAAETAEGRGDVALQRGLNAAADRFRADLSSWDADHIGMHGALLVLQDLAARRAVRGHLMAV